MFFPFLEHLLPAKGAVPAFSGMVAVCEQCYDHFVGLWKQEGAGRLSRRGELHCGLVGSAGTWAYEGACILSSCGDVLASRILYVLGIVER